MRMIISPKWRSAPARTRCPAACAANRWAISPNAVYLARSRQSPLVPIPADTAVPRKTLLTASATPRFPSVKSPRAFSTGRRFAGQSRLAHVQVLCLQQSASAGTRFRRQPECTSPRHHFRNRYFPALAFPQYRPRIVATGAGRLHRMPARCSWTKSRVTLARTIALMMKKLIASPVKAERALAVRR